MSLSDPPADAGPPTATRLLDALERARQLGFFGPGPIQIHLRHAATYLPHLPSSGTVVDLGTGGGLPGLALAHWRPDLRFRLVDAMARRAGFVAAAVAELGMDVEVRCARAEILGRDVEWRGTADVVVARSLAAPAVSAEYIAPLLRTGGYALIAEPPGGDSSRWPEAGLAQLGLQAGRTLHASGGTLQQLNQLRPCPERFPRRVGVAAKRPLFGRDV